MVGEMVDEEETEEERRARRKRRKMEKRLAKAALEETKEELLETEVDVFPTSADVQPDIVSMVTIPVDMTVQTEITERKDGTLEVIETVTNVRDLKKSMFGMSMGSIRQHFRNMSDETKAAIFPGSNVFDVKGYGDELFF